jgi:uncharacterized membrane protein SpoIIM required for sporulation
VIIDLQRFVAAEEPYWRELEGRLDGLARDPAQRLDLEAIRRLHYLYERASSDLVKVATFSAQPETRQYLERLVARAYGEIHETRAVPHRWQPGRWLRVTLPATFRRHRRAFQLACALTLGGCVLGAALLALDPAAKEILLPYSHLRMNPSQRVAQEERQAEDRLKGMKAQGAAWYIQHNTRVAIGVMALGASWGVGTVLLLVANGILLGAVSVDYLLAGETKFLLGWLLPHGAVEIPAILVAGQAGLVLAGALIGWRRRLRLRERLRAVGPDLVTLMAGAALLLVWAGIVESFLSQYHEPVLPYWVKILTGTVELTLVVVYFGWAGRKAEEPQP